MSMPAGSVNYYQCDTCRKHIHTEHVDAGVTPMMLACRVTKNCQGWMQSMMYSVPPAAMKEQLILAPKFIWYTPDKQELKYETKEMRDHVNRGGLKLKEKA